MLLKTLFHFHFYFHLDFHSYLHFNFQFHFHFCGIRSTVQSLLSDPNPASPANSEASQLYERDRGYVTTPNYVCGRH